MAFDRRENMAICPQTFERSEPGAWGAPHTTARQGATAANRQTD